LAGGGKKLLVSLIVCVFAAIFVLSNTSECQAESVNTITSGGTLYFVHEGLYTDYTSWRFAWANATFIGTPHSISLINCTFTIHEGSSDTRLYYLDNARFTLNGQDFHDPVSHTVGRPSGTYIYKTVQNCKTITGLTPNTIYPLMGYSSFKCAVNGRIYEFENVRATFREPLDVRYLYTALATPIISFKDIKDNKLTVQWNTMGNPDYTKYTLQRRVSGGNWVDVVIDTTGNSFTDTNLVPETNYEYRLYVKHICHDTWPYYTDKYDIYSDIKVVSTTADPSVAAALEAASQAQAAKEAAFSSRTASEKAEAKATEAVELIKGLDTKFTTQLTNIQNQMQPAILSVKTTNGATATKSGSINIVATAINASQYRYRVNNGAFSGWQLSPVINVNSLSSGVNVIEVQATNSLEEGAPVSSGYITVFNLP